MYSFVQTILEFKILVVKQWKFRMEKWVGQHSICGGLSMLLEYFYLSLVNSPEPLRFVVVVVVVVVLSIEFI